MDFEDSKKGIYCGFCFDPPPDEVVRLMNGLIDLNDTKNNFYRERIVTGEIPLKVLPIQP